MSQHKSTPKPEPKIKPKVTPVFGPLKVGKSLFWNDVAEQIYFVDAQACEVHRFDPRTNEHVAAKVGTGDKALAFVIPIAEVVNNFIIGYGTDIVEISWDGKSEQIDDLKVLITVDSRPDIKINSGTVTPRGSLLVGTHSPYGKDGKPQKDEASLFLYKDNQLTPIIEKVTVANGMAFSPCRKVFYFVDTKAKKVDKFKYNPMTEEFTDREEFFDFEKKKVQGLPVGLTVDAEGHVWVTTFGGGAIIRVDKDTGEEIFRVTGFEACQIMSSVFSGPFLRELYVASARFEMTDKDIKQCPKSGYFFRVTNLGSISGLKCLAYCPKDTPNE